MSVMDVEEMGPIDYIVLEWPGAQPKGDVAPMIVDLADRGIIRVLDIAFMIKREDGTVDASEIGDRLHVSANTVKTQALSAYRKLDVGCRSEAVARGRAVGLIDG